MSSTSSSTMKVETAPTQPDAGGRVSSRSRTPSHLQRWAAAYHRANAVRTRPSTVAAAEFFDANACGATEEEQIETLPRRLRKLCEYLNLNNGEADNVNVWTSVSPDPTEARRDALTAAVFASAPPTFLPSFRALFSSALEARQARWEDQEDLERSGVSASFSEIGCSRSMEEEGGGGRDNGAMPSGVGGDIDVRPPPNDPDNWEREGLYGSLRVLGWIGRKLRRPLGEALHESILKAVRDRIEGEYEADDMYELVAAWKDSIVEPWVRDVVGDEAFDQDGWAAKLDFAASECFCQIRIGEIFDIVADYPDSLPAVRELRSVLDRTRMHGKLADELRGSLRRRLIHPGANTSQIIDVYINTIKVLREIDPSDRLLEAVADPVRTYLRGRSDTVRCIITSLTDEEAGGDLYEELRRQDARPLEQAQLDSDDEEEPPDFSWQPPPSIHKQRGAISGLGSHATNSAGDILSMLVGIYGSKELFVNEYRVMLADKLLANLDYDTDKEVHNLELLKLRFGEISMRQCEIMIKDIDDSKRIITNIHSTIKTKGPSKSNNEGASNAQQLEAKNPAVDAAIISHIFWPALQKEQVKHHPRIQSQLDQFSIEYAKLKNPRRLVWLGQLGTVQLELEVVEQRPDGRLEVQTREFTCSPLQASLMSHFEDQEQWTASDLSNETGVSEDVIKKRMGYWINNRVIQTAVSEEGEVVYELASVDDLSESEHASTGGAGSAMDEEDDGSEGQAVSVSAQEEEEMQAYESYIVGMLTNLGQLPLERIHNMLKMFVTGSDHKYDKSAQQLSVFLRHLCRQDKLECGPDGMYKLIKK